MESLHPERKVKKIIWKLGKDTESTMDSSEQEDSPAASQESNEKRRRCDTLQLYEPHTKNNSDRPCIIAAIPISASEECKSNSSLVLTGTASKGGTVPPIGAVDIGVGKSAYYFRISVPGVKKDSDQFNCEIVRDGKICIRGVTTTGGETISRYSRIFKMKIQHQRPPGPFCVSFRLPGPVDPRMCFLDFTNDGIFEGVVGKSEE